MEQTKSNNETKSFYTQLNSIILADKKWGKHVNTQLINGNEIKIETDDLTQEEYKEFCTFLNKLTHKSKLILWLKKNILRQQINDIVINTYNALDYKEGEN